jgi:hypothetical protein
LACQIVRGSSFLKEGYISNLDRTESGSFAGIVSPVSYNFQLAPGGRYISYCDNEDYLCARGVRVHDTRLGGGHSLKVPPDLPTDIRSSVSGSCGIIEECQWSPSSNMLSYVVIFESVGGLRSREGVCLPEFLLWRAS